MDKDKHFEERTVTLKHTKQRLTEQEAKDLRKKHDLPEPIAQVEEPVGGGGYNCGPTFFEISGGHTYACRICYEGSPTQWPVKSCIELPW